MLGLSTRLPTLYTFRRCPYAMRARMALASAGIAYQTVEVSLRDKPPELLAISPKGTVPVLQLSAEDGEAGAVLDQSLDIMRWALGQSDPTGLLTAHNLDEVNRWITLCDVAFKPLLDRYKYWNRHPDMSQEAHRERAVEAFIRPLNTVLVSEGYVLGSRASLADVAIFPFVRQFAAVDSAWFDAQPLPAVQAWLSGWLNSELFLLIMKKQ